MKCPDCKSLMKEVEVNVEEAKNNVLSYQCPKCGHFDFEKVSADRVVEELKIKEESPLRIKQKVIKLSQGRIGMYFNQDVARSVDLKPGKEVYVSVPDKKHIIIRLED